MDYSNLSRAQLSLDYLHTNSTTHEFLFGALAELVDNARDASATKLNIFNISDASLRGGFILCFLDDGEGMDPGETASIVTFGKSGKKCIDLHQIGMYGNGLKSGSMRIGNDLLLFTKKGDTRSCLFLSRTFHEEENIEEVIVPLPSFDSVSCRPIAADARAKRKHDVEMQIILKYSPFKTIESFFNQFDRLTGQSGTLVMIYNLKLLDSGQPELDVATDPYDVVLANPSTHEFDSDEGLMPEKKSFRAYAAILYMDPRMRIYIQNRKVRTKRLACCLYKPRLYKYTSNRFKARAENEAKRAINDALVADSKALEAESKAKDLENKIGSSTNKEQRAALRKAHNYATECRGKAHIKRQVAERKTKSLKDPKTLDLIFGLNLENRSHDGVFVYNCSRLVKMYEKVGLHTEGGIVTVLCWSFDNGTAVDNKDHNISGQQFCSGIVGLVDVPYLVLEPTHNKQDFADAKEYRHLLRAMKVHMVQYCKDVGFAQQDITKFWESFGYLSSAWRDPPSQDVKFVRRRVMQLSATLQCDLCLKWRMVPFNSSNMATAFPDHWVCNMNTDQQYNTCSSAEQRLNLPEGVLKKEVKSQEQRTKDLEEEILRKTDMLEKLQNMRVVQTSRDGDMLLRASRNRPVISRKNRTKSPPLPPWPGPLQSKCTISQGSRSLKKSRRSHTSLCPSSRSAAPSSSNQMGPRQMGPNQMGPNQMGPNQMGPNQMGPNQMGPNQMGPRQMGPNQMGPNQMGPNQMGPNQMGPNQMGPRQMGPNQMGPNQMGPNQMGPNQMGPNQMGPRQVGPRQVGPRQVGPRQVGPRQVGPRQVGPRQVGPRQVGPRQVGPNQMGPNQMGPNQMGHRQVGPNQMGHRQVGHRQVTGPSLLSRQTATGRAKAVEHPDIPTKKQRVSRRSPESSDKQATRPSENPDNGDLNGDMPPSAQVRHCQDGCWSNLRYEVVEDEPTAHPPEAEHNNNDGDQVDEDVGCRVEARVNSKWYSGTVTEISGSGRWKVKFDHHPKDKYDKWFDKAGTHVRLLDVTQDTRASRCSSLSHDGAEASTSSTASELAAISQIAEDIADGYRTCLRYFLPPQWIMGKDAVTEMSLEELSRFPLDDFFDNYERGLRRLVKNFQTEAAFRKQESETAKTKLATVRKLIAQLLRSTNQEVDIDPDEAGDQVDDLLTACVRQAISQMSERQILERQTSERQTSER